MHVLVIDDERAFAEVVAELLRSEGHEVELAHDGHQVLSGLKDGQLVPDLVLCDVMLPKLNGATLVVELRKRFPDHRMPIVLLSASADPQVDLPDLAFLPKPIDFDELLDCIDRLGADCTHVTAA